MRNGLSSICYGIAIAALGVVLYVVDIEVVSLLGAFVLGGGGLLALFGLFAVGRSLSSEDRA